MHNCGDLGVMGIGLLNQLSALFDANVVRFQKPLGYVVSVSVKPGLVGPYWILGDNGLDFFAGVAK
jgi:hypothetical protein